MDLFNSTPLDQLPGTPLAERLRPQSFDQFVGQEKIVIKIKKSLGAGKLPNLIFWGPPGSGKTTMAKVISKQVQCDFRTLNATQSGAKELREICESAKQLRIEQGRRTILFIDEIHRFNKGQQDVLLPYIERGDVSIIGATTENPGYEINKALLSRAEVCIFERLNFTQLEHLLKNYLSSLKLEVPKCFTKEALDVLFSWSDGDARKLFVFLEEIQIQRPLETLTSPLTTLELKETIHSRSFSHDKSASSHYDLASALIKSVRGSDSDAALYYLACLIKGGEEPTFIARRLMILASEDVGNADPRAITLVTSCAQAAEMVGLPEAGIILAQAVCYLCSVPKSNRSYLGYKKALSLVEEKGICPVPRHLQSGYFKGSLEEVYLYPHDQVKGWVQQKYLPDQVCITEPLYQPSSHGFEKQLSEFLAWLKK